MSNTASPVHGNTGVLQHAEPAATAAQNAGREVNHLTPLYALATYKLVEWAKIFSTATATVMFLVFISLNVADYFASKDVYTEIAGKYFGWVICLVIILITIPISELLRKTFPEQKRWEVFNRKLGSPDKSDDEIKREVNKEARRDITMGVMVLIFMITIVLGLSYYRKVNLQHKSFDILDLLPAILYVTAAWCGVYFAYIWKRIITWIRANDQRRKITRLTDLCQFETRNAHRYHMLALERGEDVKNISADLAETIHRFINKGSLDGNYTAKDHIHSCIVLIKDNQTPKEGALVIGRTSSSEYTQLVQTDDLGKVTLNWVGQIELSEISINYVTYKGLWQSGTITTIDISTNQTNS